MPRGDGQQSVESLRRVHGQRRENAFSVIGVGVSRWRNVEVRQGKSTGGIIGPDLLPNFTTPGERINAENGG
jgi:hypothetical protein